MRGFLFVISLFSVCFLRAQDTPGEPPARFITRFPFKQLTGGVMLVQARFNNISTPLNFILDSGSGAISLDSSTAEEFQIPHFPSGRTINGIAGIEYVDHIPNSTIHFPGLTVDSLDFYVNNYNILTSVYGVKIDGIMGYSFLSRYIVKIDFDSLLVEVYTKGNFTYPRNGYLLHPLFTALPIQTLTIKDAKTITANFYLDTGAGLCFLMSKQFEGDSAVLLKKRKPVYIQVQGLGGRKEMRLTLIKEVQIGPYKFRKVPTDLLDDEYNATSYPFIGGLVGDDILRRFNLIFNYDKKEIHLLPNTHFKDEFDYSYTGLNMYYDSGKIKLDEVIPKSPAYRAGLKKDDVIVAINSNFSNDI
ncbi:MAG TPA: aspartyl protease family protein, partial [Chitinophagaceae bacterium]|nr:aspartyl protease family protein [Chitinophagaceae bacterium]